MVTSDIISLRKCTKKVLKLLEILFLTLMESTNTNAGKLIKNQLLTATEWHLLRYRLIKSLHKNESIIRSEVTKNQQYFVKIHWEYGIKYCKQVDEWQ